MTRVVDWSILLKCLIATDVSLIYVWNMYYCNLWRSDCQLSPFIHPLRIKCVVPKIVTPYGQIYTSGIVIKFALWSYQSLI